MNAYTAQLIFKITCSDVPSEQYEEQWRLVFANDERKAIDEARNVAKNEEATFVDRHGRTINWQFIAVKELQKVELENGVQLFSMIKEVTPIAEPVWTEAAVG